MTKLAILTLTPSALLLAAQSANPLASQEETTKVVHVRYVPAESVRDLISHSIAYVSANNGLKAVVLRGSPSGIAAAEQAIKELDLPSPAESARDVELTVYVIGASAQSSQNTQSAAEMEPVIRQLKAVFPYGSYQILDSMLIRAVEGRSANTKGLLKNFPAAQTGFLSHYLISCDLAPRSVGPNPGIRLNKFAFSTGVPNSDIRVDLDTNLDLQDGQKVVVGKTNIDDGNSALFVVVTAKFVS